MECVLGWDIGGAHLKAARVEGGRVRAVLQRPSPLWLGLEHVQKALREAQAELGSSVRHAVTMTAELCDIFPNRTEGVRRLVELLSSELPDAELLFYAADAGFVPPEVAAGAAAERVASANWHAAATLAARRHPFAVFVDMGSTTTDIIPICEGRVQALGQTDSDRLAAGELLYTGLTRTPVMALCRRIPFAGSWTSLANEYFATTADIYRLLGELPEEADLLPTADGREKTVPASRARLARMLGRDATAADAPALLQAAAYFAEIQLRSLHDAAWQVLSRVPLPKDAPLVGAGIGRNVLVRLAARLERPYCDLFANASEARHAPAVAVALLAAGRAGE